MNQSTSPTMNGVTIDNSLAANWVSARQLRLYAGRLQGRSDLLPLSTWKRWKRQLGISGEGDRLYSPEQARLILEFCQWLLEGGSVKGFQINKNIQVEETFNEQRERVWNNQQQQQQQRTQSYRAPQQPSYPDGATTIIC
ncbi:MAG TPA: hypothetical protein V6C65_15050 [Allocoleopsis sp.]